MTNNVYGVEERVEEYMRNALKANSEAMVTESPPAHTPPEHYATANSEAMVTESPPAHTPPEPPDSSATGSQESPSINAADEKSTHISTPLDAWIDKLTEFEENKLTTPQSEGSQLSIADALLKLEARRDVPRNRFSGNPLDYVDFIDRSKTHIHDKANLTDDMRMIQLKMHVTGDVERAISG